MAIKKRSVRERFVNAFLTCWEVHRQAVPSKSLINIYQKALVALTIDQIEKGFALAITSLDWFPKPNDIYRLIGMNRQANDGAALKVANDIIGHLRRHGRHRAPDLEHDPIARDLMTRRWPYYRWAASVLESELQWWVKQFVEAYKAMADVPQPAAIPDERVGNLIEGVLKGIDSSGPVRGKKHLPA